METYTWSHPDRIWKSAKSKRSNIRRKTHQMDLARGRNGKGIKLNIAHQTVYFFQVRTLRISIGSSNQVPRATFPHFLCPRGKKQNSFWTRELYFKRMRKTILTPEEQETVRKSKDSSVVMTAYGTTHTTEEAAGYVYDLDMCIEVQLLKEPTAVLSLAQNVRGKRPFV